MFQGENSQVKRYVGRQDHDYSGKIIRWQIEDPILYRPAGFSPPRVVPTFAHFLPAQIAISEDGGKTFGPVKTTSSASK